MKKILAVSVGAVLVSAFMVSGLSNNSFAQVSAESRVLQAILGLTDQVKQQTTEIKGKYDDIQFDLNLKKKFWEHRFNTSSFAIGLNEGSTYDDILELLDFGPGTVGNVTLGVFIDDCDIPEDACAYNVESIQLVDNGTSRNVKGLFVGDLNEAFENGNLRSTFTDISDKDIFTPTNLLVDTGIGRIGAGGGTGTILFFLGDLSAVGVTFDLDEAFAGDLEFNGEKPQGMLLGFFFLGMSSQNDNNAQILITIVPGVGSYYKCYVDGQEVDCHSPP